MANFNSVIKGLFKVGKTIRQAFSDNKNKKKTSPIKRSNSLQSRIDKVTNNIPQQKKSQQKKLNLNINDIMNIRSKNRAVEQTEKVLNNQPVGLTKDEIEEKSYDIRRPNKAEEKLVKHKLFKGDIDLSGFTINTPERNSNVTGDYDLDAMFGEVSQTETTDDVVDEEMLDLFRKGAEEINKHAGGFHADDFGYLEDDKDAGGFNADGFDYLDALEKASEPQDATIDWDNDVASQPEVASAVIEEFLGAVATVGLDSDSADYTINFTMNMIKNYGMIEVAQFITSRPDIVTLVHQNNNHYRETFADYRDDMADYIRDLYSGLSGFVDEDEFEEVKKGNFARGWEFEGNMSKVKNFNPHWRASVQDNGSIDWN